MGHGVWMRRLALALALSAMAACGGDPQGDADAGSTPSSTIGPEGGLVQGDGVTLSIPENALTEKVDFKILVSDVGAPEVEGRVRISKVFQIIPEKTHFLIPATVTLTYLEDRIPEKVPADSADVRRVDFTRAQERLNAILVDPDAKTVAGETESLGSFWSTVPAGPRPANVKVTPAATTVFQGQKVKYTAEVRDQNDRIMPGQPVVWSTSDAKVATIDQTGEATAVGPGVCDVLASAGSARGKATLQVASTTAYPMQLSWENPVPQGNALFGLAGDATHLLVSGDNGTVFSSNGTAWTRLSSEPLTTFRAVAIRPSGEILATGLQGTKGVLLRHDGTKGTEQTFLDAQPVAIYADAKLGMAVGDGPQVLLMDAAGSWSAIPSPTTESLLTVDGSTGELIVVGSRGAVYKRAGNAWVALSSAPLPQLQNHAVLHGTDAWAVSATVLRHFTAGAWQVETLPSSVGSVTFSAIGFAGDTLLLSAFDKGGNIFLITNDLKGGGYQKFAVPGHDRVNALWGRSATEIYAAGDKGALFKFDGGTFTALRVGGVGEVVKITGFSGAQFAASNVCLAADCSTRTGKVLERQTNGTWNELPAAFSGELTTIGGTGPKDLWVGTPTSAYHYDGTAWGIVSAAGGVNDFMNCGGTVYGSGSGKIFAASGSTLSVALDFGQAVALRSIGCTANGIIIVGDNAIVQIEGGTAKVLDPTKDMLQPAPFRAVFAMPDGTAFIGGDARYVLYWDGAKFTAFDQPGGLPLGSIHGMWGTGFGDLYAVGTLTTGEGIALHFNGAFWAPLDPGTSGVLNTVFGVKPGEVWMGGENGAIVYGKAP